ncbi:MAG: GNAT family N-acetyltransferase [Steroidobacteraceae bacterium]
MEGIQKDAIVVTHNQAASRFEAQVSGQLALAEYCLAPGTVTFTHTRVPEQLSGRGIATQLIKAGLAMARERGLQVIPQCTFVAAYIEKHPEVQDLLANTGR